MNKIKEFYMQVLEDEALTREVTEILGTVSISEATDEMLEQIGALAKKLGYDILTEEARAYFISKDEELEDEELDAVAGGKGTVTVTEITEYVCSVGGQAGKDENNFGENAKACRREMKITYDK